MSLIHAESRKTYASQRGVSQGASITLAATSGGYSARFECATKAVLVLGDRHLTDHGLNGERMPVLLIPTEELHRAITALSQTFSVALVDTVTDETSTRFVLVWLIKPHNANGIVVPEETVPAAEPDPNQGNLNLDEY